MPVAGVAEISEGAGGFVRQVAQNYLATREDVVVPYVVARDYGLRDGTEMEGLCRDAGNGRRVLVEVTKAGGMSPEQYKQLPHFQDLVSISPNEVFHLAKDQSEVSLRVIDLIAPIGRGQRGLIVSPPKAGKTTMLEHIGLAIVKNHPEAHLMLLLVDERPEEVTHFKRAVPAEMLASTSDSASDAHIRLARLAWNGPSAWSRPGRGHPARLAHPARPRQQPRNRPRRPHHVGRRRLQGPAVPAAVLRGRAQLRGQRILTIIATALIETGSRMDEVIFQEFKGTGNMELILDRAIADRRIFPAVDVLKSGTRREELLVSPDELRQRHPLRRALAELSTVDATQFLIDKLQKTPSNAAFLSTLAVPTPVAASARRFR